MSNHYQLVVETRQSTPSSRGSRIPGPLQGDPGAEGNLPDGACPLRGIESGARGNGSIGSRLPWSSYRATAGWADAPGWLCVDWPLSAFGAQRKVAEGAYRRFVSEGRRSSSPWVDLKRQLYPGDEAFVDKMLTRVGDESPLSEIPATQRRRPPKPLEHYAKTNRDRDKAITAAYRSGGYSMKAIGDYFGSHYSMVSRIVNRVA